MLILSMLFVCFDVFLFFLFLWMYGYCVMCITWEQPATQNIAGALLKFIFYHYFYFSVP